MRRYRDVLAMPGVSRVVASQLTARFPYGMLSIALLIYIHERTGSYGAAGIVLAASSVGQAISGPFTSRLMGVFGMRPVLAVTTTVSSLTLVFITLSALDTTVYAALGFVVGISLPPVQAAARTIYPKLVNGDQLTPLFSLDASAQEIIWVLGPVLATFAGTQAGGAWAMALCIVFLAGGGAWFLSSGEVGQVRIPRSKQRFGSVLRKPPILVSVMAGFLLVGTWASVEAGIVTAFGPDSAQGGIVLAISSIASMIAGFAIGHRSVSPWALARRMAVMALGAALTLAALDFWWLALAMVVAGIGTAPALAAMSNIISSSVKFSDTAEAFGWAGSGQLIGAALASGISGMLLDSVGSIGAFWVATVCGVLGTIMAAVGWRVLPDLRGRDSSPHPDTGAVSAIV